MKYDKNRLLAILMIIMLFTAGCGARENIPDVQGDKPIPISVESVSTGSISKEYTYAARIKPQEQVIVIPEVSGKVQEVYFDIGDTVQAEDTLFKIEEESIRRNIRDLEKQLENLDLGIELQVLSLESAKNGQHRQQMLQLEQQLKSAQINYSTSKKNFQDIKTLYKNGLASTQQYDQAEAAFKQAQVALDSARESYELYITQLSQTTIEVKEKQLQQTRIQKEQLLLSLENLYDMLKNTSVKSPISGIVASRGVEKNQMVNAQIAPFTIIQTETLLIDVGVSESVVGRIKTGDQVRIVIGSLSEDPFYGEITALAPAADERTSAYLVRIQIENEKNRIKPGMFSEVSFSVDTREDVVVVPINAVLFDQSITTSTSISGKDRFQTSGGVESPSEAPMSLSAEQVHSEDQFVYVVTPDERARKVYVKTGIDNGTQIEIIEGLSVGDLLVVEGQNYVEDHIRVRIISEPGMGVTK